jgi:hypothetical protein
MIGKVLLAWVSEAIIKMMEKYQLLLDNTMDAGQATQQPMP